MRKVLRLLVVLLILLIGGASMFYMFYIGMGTNYNTETALQSDYSVTLSTQALFIRAERPVTSELDGAYLYAVPDGEKVSRGGVIAQVFANEDQIAARVQLSEIETELENFAVLIGQSDASGSSLDALSRRISIETATWEELIRKNDLQNLAEARAALLQTVCRKQLMTGEVIDFSQKISALQTQQAALKTRYVEPIGAVNSPAAGYFVVETDGYENVLSLNMARDMTVEMLESLQPEETDGLEIGRVVTDHVWYAVCRMSADEARKLEKGDKVKMILPSGSEKVRVTVEAINRESVDGEAAVVLKGEENVEKIVSLRNEAVQIEIASYSGLKINRNAVHLVTIPVTTKDANGVQKTEEKEIHGVYVIYGEQIRFREISPIYWGETFVICNKNAKPTGSVAMLKQYDQVILGGKELYDGKYVS